MQAFNHVAFGALLAVSLPEAAALPLSFGSHFALDTFPHYGNDHKAPRASRPYIIRILIDALLSIASLIWYVHLAPGKSGAILLCVFLSVLPDLVWPLAYIVNRTGLLWRLFVFHKQIQLESRAGIYYELIYLMIFVSLLSLRGRG